MIAEWADEVFPDRTVHNALCKLMLEEIPEFALNIWDEEEYADLVILIFDIAYLQGIDIQEAVMAKMEKNRARKWEIDEESGLMRHVGYEY